MNEMMELFEEGGFGDVESFKGEVTTTPPSFNEIARWLGKPWLVKDKPSFYANDSFVEYGADLIDD